ncbi:MAG TPA: hypothetical protein VNT42_05135 [Sphingomonas sp.]|nr:hypothetical protein [Sphingomonas sp.]
MLPGPQPQLSPSEWRDVATALRDANEMPAPRAAQSSAFGHLFSWFRQTGCAVPEDDGVRAIRRFVDEVRVTHEVSPSLAETLAVRGFNDRQISALAILAD